jgi:hypothetical protein
MSLVATLLFAVDLFVAVTAIAGGLALMTGLEAGRLPAEWLDGTPFRSYLVPGGILALVVGGSAALAATTLLIDERVGSVVSIIAATILVSYVGGEIRILSQPTTPTNTEVLYLVVGVLMIVLGAVDLSRW